MSAAARARSRAEILAVVDDALRLGEELAELTNSYGVRTGSLPTPAGSVTMLLGARALNGLFAVSYLAEWNVDDQIAILGRSLAESAIDVDYLNEDTVRKANGAEFTLSTDVKAMLFASFKPLTVFKMTCEAEDLEPDDPLPAELAKMFPEGHWDGVRLGRDEALKYRKEHGIEGNTYWAGISNQAMVNELMSVTPEQRQGRLKQLRRIFRDFSFFSHTNPNDVPYVNRATGGLRSAYRDHSIIGMACIAAMDVFYRLALVLDEDVEPRLVDLLKRLQSVPDRSVRERRR